MSAVALCPILASSRYASYYSLLLVVAQITCSMPLKHQGFKLLGQKSKVI